MKRRRLAAVALATMLGLSVSACSATTPDPTPSTTAASTPVALDLGALETKYGATLGVYAIDTGTGRSVAYRDGTRFPYASTFKVLLAAAVLHASSDADLRERIPITQDQILPYSAITEKHVGVGMPVQDVIAAALEHSDNTAANLLFPRVGGPAGLQSYLARLGDTTTRVSRTEMELNEATPGDTRDTTTPRAIVEDLRSITLGSALTTADRRRVIRWMDDRTNGPNLIRAGLPDGWTAIDKPGGGAYGVLNDIAVVRPEKGAPIVIAVMSRKAEEDAPYDNALIVDATRAALAALR
jgi:beta-lactamase class A